MEALISASTTCRKPPDGGDRRQPPRSASRVPIFVPELISMRGTAKRLVHVSRTSTFAVPPFSTTAIRSSLQAATPASTPAFTLPYG